MVARLVLRLVLVMVWSAGLASAAVTPVAEWRFDESSGTSAADSSGNGNTATVTAPTWVAGRTGNALLCDGVNTRVDLPPNLVTASSGTVSGWIKTTTNFTDYAMLFYAADGTPGDGLGPQNELSLHVTSAEKLECQFEGGYAGDALNTSSGAINNNQWRHVALTWSASGVVLFLDGLQVASKPHPGASFACATLRLGASGMVTRLFTGTIDQVTLYTSALTPTEVRSLSGNGTLQFSTTGYTVAEGTASITITATRVGGTQGAVGCSYATGDGTALAASDYTTKTGTLAWADGIAGSKTFTISITNDALAEGEEAFVVQLSAPTGGATLGVIPTASVTITDNDGAGTLKYTAAYSVTEGTATVTATVSRTGGSTGAVTVNYATQDLTALAGSDYTAVSGILSWASGEVTSKTFTVPITNDTAAESLETLTLLLTAPTGGAFLLPNPNGSVAITDNDQAGMLQFSAPVVTVGERTSTATFTVTRTGGSLGAVGCSYATSNGTALAGSDYTTKTGTLAWTTGTTTSKTFTVTILNDLLFEASEGFDVTLSAPTGGALLGAQVRCVGRIQDNENPILHWRLDELTGTSVADSTENGNTGTAVAPTWAAAHFSNGLTSNGTTTLVNGPLSKVKSDLGSVALWCKTATAPAADAMLFYGSSVATGNGSGPENELHVHFDTAGRLCSFIKGVAANVSITSPSAYADNQWHQVVFTWDINAQAVLYVDGQQVGAVTHDATNFTCSNKLRLAAPGAASNLFAGQLDDVKIYDRALAASEIVGLFDPLPPVTFTTPTTIGVGVTTWEDRTIIVNGTTLTVDGYHRFANLTVQNGGVVTHTACTTSSTSSLDLRVVGPVVVDATSAIDVSGKGYLAGYTVGNTTTGGATGGAGGSHGGYGSIHTAYEPGTPTAALYGDPENPTDPGAGGGPSYAGAGGGLARITAGSVALSGAIRANGTGTGAGGGIRIDTGSISGTGIVQANGGAGGGTGGGGGRIAIYFTSGAIASWSLKAHGGDPTGNVLWTGGSAGTIYLRPSTAPRGELRIDNNGDGGQEATTISGSRIWDISISNKGWVSGNGPWTGATGTIDNGTLAVDQLTLTDLSLTNSGVLTCLATTAAEVHSLTLSVSASLSVDATSAIDVSGKGYLAGYTVGNTTTGGATGGAGGSHGGYGSIHTAYEPGTPTAALYGDPENPTDPGAGGGPSYAGAGGGLARITAGSVALSGAIKANGTGIGAGGGIRIDTGTISGSGIVQAFGGAGGGTGGGGGRIAIYFTSGAIASWSLKAHGGDPTGNVLWTGGSAGTIYLRPSTAPRGELRIDNNGDGGQQATTITGPRTWDISISNKGWVSGNGPWTGATGTINNGTLAVDQLTLTDLSLTNSGVLTCLATTATEVHSLTMSVSGSLSVDATSAIDVSGKGYLAGYTVGNTTTGGATGYAGGSYGGYGSEHISGTRNVVYGDFTDPQNMGAGGGVNYGGAGGGLVRITVGTATIAGAVRANATGSGAGGGIRLDAGMLTGSGNIRADGGSQYYTSGGGGRIAVYYGSGSSDGLTILATGGDPTGLNAWGGGGTGTVLVKQASGTYAVLTLDNLAANAQIATPVFFGALVPAINQLAAKCPIHFTTVTRNAAEWAFAGDLNAFDFDDDGLYGWDEAIVGTNPVDADSNDDGMNDSASIAAGLDPLAPDTDSDGLSNSAELAAGTNPFRLDTDGDGVGDASDVFPLDPTASIWPPPSPTDTTPPVISLTTPSTLVPLP